jgi:DNA-directed RNA polymerase subunit RPC12/RpoP
MKHELFKRGGPLNITPTGRNTYSMKVDIPRDAQGMIARECPTSSCSPAYFKVKPGTGITGGQTKAFCPYCSHKDEPSNFTTKGQIEYAKGIVTREALNGVETMIREGLGLDASGQRTIGGGFLSSNISYKSGQRPHIWRPFEDVLRRDLTCPKCTLEHAVFGIAIWCPDCGSDIFLTHVSKEFDVVKLILGDVENRKERLGPRVAARDIENALEDTVSIFEAVLRAITRRHLKLSLSSEETEEVLRKQVANKYQNISFAADVANEQFGVQLFSSLNKEELEALRNTFEKRHPITHNLGIVDRKYLEKAVSGELVGRDIHVSAEEVSESIELCLKVLNDFYPRIFGSAIRL